MTGASFLLVARLYVCAAGWIGATGALAAGSGFSAFSGAWLMQGTDCADVFSSAKGPSFKKPVDMFAPAFIVSGNRLRTPQATCVIRSIKPNGDREALVLKCANSVAEMDVRVLLKVLPDGTLRRFHNAEDTTGTAYQRCSQ
jgi:hypothetical protein